MAKFCSQCGTPIIDGTRFCSQCGAPVEENSAAQTVNSPALSYDKTENRSPVSGGLKGSFFTATGRLNRMAYLIRSLVLLIPNGIAFALMEGESTEAIVVGALLSVATSVAGIMLSIRRCHDINKPGWFVLLLFVPLVNIGIGLYLLFAKGTDGPNPYGPDPLQS